MICTQILNHIILMFKYKFISSDFLVLKVSSRTQTNLNSQELSLNGRISMHKLFN